MYDALVGHLVGDYLLQNDWMAQNKKRNSFPCAVHCLLWTIAVCLCAGWMSPIAWCALFATHFIQDRKHVVLWWMKSIGQERFATGVLSPWSVVVVDNIWHIVTIWIVSKWV